MGDLVAKGCLLSSSLKSQFNIKYTGYFFPLCIPRYEQTLLYILKIKIANTPSLLCAGFHLTLGTSV